MASEVMRLLRRREPEVCEVPVVNLHGLGVRFFDVIGFFSVFPWDDVVGVYRCPRPTVRPGGLISQLMVGFLVGFRGPWAAVEAEDGS